MSTHILRGERELQENYIVAAKDDELLQATWRNFDTISSGL